MKHTFSFVLKSLIITVECLAWLLVMYFAPAPKHMIQLSVDYRQDSKIQIRLWKSLVEDIPSLHHRL